jgi:hypothetical protein
MLYININIFDIYYIINSLNILLQFFNIFFAFIITYRLFIYYVIRNWLYIEQTLETCFTADQIVVFSNKLIIVRLILPIKLNFSNHYRSILQEHI